MFSFHPLISVDSYEAFLDPLGQTASLRRATSAATYLPPQQTRQTQRELHVGITCFHLLSSCANRAN